MQAWQRAPADIAATLSLRRSSSTSAKYQRPVMWDAGAGKWVTDQKRLSAFEACLAKVSKHRDSRAPRALTVAVRLVGFAPAQACGPLILRAR
jgi:hypothetical protein